MPHPMKAVTPPIPDERPVREHPRYILIDNNSGFIFADSAQFNGGEFVGTPMEFVKAFDESIGETGRTYREVSKAEVAHNQTAYHVYLGTLELMEGGHMDLVWLVDDGTDEDTIQVVTDAGTKYEDIGLLTTILVERVPS